MTETDDLITEAVDLGYQLLNTWMGAFRSLAVSTAELLDPDLDVVGDNAYVATCSPKVTSGLRCSALTYKNQRLEAHRLTISPAGVQGSEIRNAAGAVTGHGPTKLQRILVKVTRPEDLPPHLKNGMYEGGLYDEAGTLVSSVSLKITNPNHGP